jgi:hypothetical protein
VPGDPASTPAPLTRSGAPVAAVHTRGGALAAADNDLALISASVEQQPARFTALVRDLYVPADQAGTLTQAAQERQADPAGMTNFSSGGHALALIAARRLDRYTPSSATVTTLLGGIVWGPDLTPRQSWNLVDTTLLWQDRQWRVAKIGVDATAAPVPATVVLDGPNDTAAAYGRLAGMSSPVYGSAG